MVYSKEGSTSTVILAKSTSNFAEKHKKLDCIIIYAVGKNILSVVKSLCFMTEN